MTKTRQLTNILLLGDSIFDNKVYVENGRSVIEHLQKTLGAHEQMIATLGAVDGAVTSDVADQLADNLRADVTHIVVSAGGNDALGQASILEEPALSMGHALDKLSVMAEHFEHDYRRMTAWVRAAELPTMLSTIYYPRFQDATYQRLACTALAFFNDVILRVAFEQGWPVMDLRLICNEASDYANEIEPSHRGGYKIASAITKAVLTHNFANRRSALFSKAA